MQFTLYEWVYIITNVFWTYTIYKFMGIFYDTRKTSSKVELLSYVAYFIFISSTYLFVNIPIVLMMSNLVAFILLSFNFESTLKNRLLSSVFIYLILMGVEMTVALISGYFQFPIFSTNNYSSSFGLIICRIFTYIVVLILNNFNNIRKGESVPNSSWFCIVLIPVSSLYIILLLFQARGIAVGPVLTGVILLLTVNFATFHLYDVITAALSERMESLLISKQNQYYEKQFELIKASLQTTSMIKHDLKNHMLSIRSLIESGNSNDSLEYIANIMDDIGGRKNYANSGNMIVDSIINFKFQEASHLGIRTSVELNIPDKFEIPSFDMTVILGNLLDNAIKAASGVKENSYIDIKIKYDKGRLLIQAANPYEGVINEENGRLLTTKADIKNHGIGLESIKRAIRRYNGTMSVDYGGNVFSSTILMYLNN